MDRAVKTKVYLTLALFSIGMATGIGLVIMVVRLIGG